MSLRARLIIDPARDAFTNMTADETLFRLAAASPFAATLRLYSWRPHAISLGRRQKPGDADLNSCRTRGIDVVKRSGGGAAVYHSEDELTYCFVCRTDVMPVPSHMQWRALFGGIIGQLGGAADPMSGSNLSCRVAACFACSGDDEPTVRGRKFVGSARRKTRGIFLQHGSILMSHQPEFLRTIIRDSEVDRSVGLAELFPLASREEIMALFVAAVGRHFGCDFEAGPYSAEESRLIEMLAEEKKAGIGAGGRSRCPD